MGLDVLQPIHGASTSRLLLELARERNADLHEVNGELEDENARLRHENARLQDELAGARLMLEEVMADAAAARRAAAANRVDQPKPLSVRTCGASPSVATRTAERRPRPLGVGSRCRPSEPRTRGDSSAAGAAGEHKYSRDHHQRALRSAAAVTLQSHARALLAREEVRREQAAMQAALKLQAIVRGNAARGIAERRKYDGRFDFDSRHW